MPARAQGRGAIDARYRLQETESPHYRQRTGYNVEDSDGTLVLNLGPLTGGTLETIRIAERLGKPCLLLALDAGATLADAQKLSAWLGQQRISTLNIAGPREGKRPGMYAATYGLLDALAAGSFPLDGGRSGGFAEHCAAPVQWQRPRPIAPPQLNVKASPLP